jgi:hypothetical protein
MPSRRRRTGPGWWRTPSWQETPCRVRGSEEERAPTVARSRRLRASVSLIRVGSPEHPQDRGKGLDRLLGERPAFVVRRCPCPADLLLTVLAHGSLPYGATRRRGGPLHPCGLDGRRSCSGSPGRTTIASADRRLADQAGEGCDLPLAALGGFHLRDAARLDLQRRPGAGRGPASAASARFRGKAPQSSLRPSDASTSPAPSLQRKEHDHLASRRDAHAPLAKRSLARFGEGQGRAFLPCRGRLPRGEPGTGKGSFNEKEFNLIILGIDICIPVRQSPRR